MHIVVCVKRIPDPEVSAIPFRIDPETLKRVEVPGLKLVMSPYDEQCLEAALRIREQQGEDVKITALSLGEPDDISVFKSAFSFDCDEGVFLQDPAFAGGDGYSTALALASAIRKLGNVDLILVGRQAADGDEGIVGFGLAEILDMPLLPWAASIQIENDSVIVERILDDATETIIASLPAVASISNEIGEPRQPTMRQIMAAGRRKPEIWNASDLGLSADQVGAGGVRLVVENVYVPQRDRACELIGEGAPAEIADALVRKLNQRRVLT